MKKKITLTLISVVFIFLSANPSYGQLKETVQLATLTPLALVNASERIEPSHKRHFTLSTTIYLGSYLVTESTWKAVGITLLIGLTKELVYDGFMNRGTPRLDDMGWNALGAGQGMVFTFSLRL